MPQTPQSEPPNAAQQDAWIGSVMGVHLDRAAKRAAAQTELAARVAEIDAALAGLTGAVKAVNLPDNRRVLDTVAGQLGHRRDVMAAASDPAEIAKQLAAAPALLQDIAKSTAAAQRIAATPASANPASAPSAPPASAPSAAPPAAAPPASAPGAEQPAAGPVADFFKGIGHAIVGAATTVAHGVEDAARTVGTAASVLAHKVAGKPPKECLDGLKPWLAVFKNIKADNPVGREFDFLTARLTIVESMSSGLTREDAFDKIADAAVLAGKSAKQAYEANLIVEQHFAAVERNLADVALPDPQKGAVIAQRDTLRGDFDHAYATADTVADLLASLNTLKGQTASLQAQSISVADATALVTADLTAAKTEIDKLKDAGKKADFAKQYDALQKRLTDAGKIADISAQKQALFALGADTVSLLGAVTKLQFGEQAATPEGKKQIDDMIKGMPDISHDPAQQAVCKAAIDACYKVPLAIPEGMEMSRLPALYKMMTQIPAGDLQGMDTIEYESDPTIGASY